MEEVNNTNQNVPFDPFFMGVVDENGALTSRLIFSKEEAIKYLELGYYPVLEVEKPHSENPLDDFIPKYAVEEIEGIGLCVNTYYEKVINYNYILSEIDRLKAELASTDYIWLKTWEARIVGREDPYSAEELSKSDTERELIREEINKLESLLTVK